MGKTQIYFDNSSGLFVPGERVTGKVIWESDEETQVLGLTLNLFGKVKVSCDPDEMKSGRKGQHRRLSSKRHSDKYCILKDFQKLSIESVQSDGISGRTSCPFDLTLPDDLPSSFEGPYGWIRYRMEVIVQHSFWDHRCEAEAELHVQGCYDLNNLDPMYKNVQVENRRMVFNDSFGVNCLELTLELEKKAYVPQETLKFAATVDFKSQFMRHPPIPGVKVALFQEQIYRIKETRKRHVVKIHDMNGPTIYCNAIEVWNGNIELPQLPPTYLGGNSRIIDLQYYLRVRLGVSEQDIIDICIKLQIGTIGLRTPTESTLPTTVNGQSIDFLHVQPGPSRSSRRSSADIFLGGEPIPGPSSAPPLYLLCSEEAETLCLDAMGLDASQENPNGEPPEYLRQPPFFLRKGAKHLSEDFNAYSTL